MNWHVVHRILPVSRRRRRALLHLFSALLALSVLIPTAQTARADNSNCIQFGSQTICVTFPPPDLLNLNQSLYSATAAQQTSLGNLEAQAVSNIITGHHLSAGDANAVLTWGRADAEAELYALLVNAINTSATSRTTDQQNAVDWLTAVAQRHAVAAAEDAGSEYVKWAGLDPSTYRSLLNSNASESSLETFLKGTPQNYNLMDSNGIPLDPSQYEQSAGGWCVYRSPAPYGSEYTGYHDSTCSGPCLFCLINPTPPSFDQFTKWGEADAAYSLLNSGDFQSAAKNIAIGMGIGVPLAAAVAGAAPASQLAAAVAREANLAETAGEEAASWFDLVSEVTDTFAVASGIGVALTVIVALVTAIIEAINLINAAKLPAQLATLITNAETTPPDPKSLESSSNGTTSLFSLFVGATLPTPLNQTCDNSPQVIGNSSLGPVYGPAGNCLNPTAIPPTSPSDPQFLVQAQGSTTQTLSPTITWKDAANGTTTTARLSENWFIENGSVQTLRITYTDWDGKEQNAWLAGDPTDGYAFLNFSVPADSSTTVDPSTCVANGLCSYGTSIDYVGSDGQDYSASVHGYTSSTGSPSYFTPVVEGSPVDFNANDYAPVRATTPITYTWQFEEACANCLSGPLIPIAYTDPINGTTATYTWQTSGTYHVSLTAIDASGNKANDTFTVSVADVPPKLQVSPTCTSVSIIACNDPKTGDVGTSMGLVGTITHAGSQDLEYVAVNWGDGSPMDRGQAGPLLTLVSPPLGVTSHGATSFTLSDSHTYANPGIYNVTVSAYDQAGNGDSKTFTETIVGRQSINFPTIPPHTYGDAPFTISATGGGSGKAVTFASTDTTVCTVSGATSGVDGSGNGTGSATLTLLKPGTCAVTASQDGSATYHPAPDVTQSFTVLAPLMVTANDKSMTYGAGVPAFDAGYSGLVNGDSSSVVSGLTCGAVDASNQPVSGSTPAGTYTITCSGGTAANYTISYRPGTLTISKANTSVTLASAPAPAVFGQPVTITAKLAVTSPGSGNPGGTVEFKDGGSDIGGCAAQTVDTTKETATCTTASLSVAAHSLTASYRGDSNFVGSTTASALSQPVNKAASTVTLAPVAPSTQGQAVTFTALVAATAPGAGTPGGTVTFKDGSTTLGTGQLGVAGGTDQATFSTSSLGVGAHTITASYGGDGNFTASTSAAATQYVNINLSGYPKLPSGAYNLSNANLAGAYFVGVSLAGANLTGSNLTGAVFTGADLSGANLSNSNFMSGATFTNANLQNANLSNSNLKGANFTGVNLSGANFTNSNLISATGLKMATLTGVIWSKTACPDGTNSSQDGGTCVGHL